MSDPKDQKGPVSDEEAIEALSKDEASKMDESKVIDAEPVNSTASTDEAKARRSFFASRTKTIGLLVLLLLIAGLVAAALYPLWRDMAHDVFEDNGLPIAMPEVPENGFYNTVTDIADFLQGAAPEEEQPKTAETSVPATEPATPAPPDPIEVLTERLAVLEGNLADLSADLREAAASAESANAKAEQAGTDLAAVTEKLETQQSSIGSAELEGLAARIQTLQAQIDDLASRPVVKQDGTAAMAEISAVNAALLNTIGTLRERVAALENREAVAPSELETVREKVASSETAAAEKIASLEAELSSVKSLAEKRAPKRERAGLLLLAVGQLEAVTVTSASFRSQLAAVQDLRIEGDESLSAPLSVLDTNVSGVASLPELSARFEAVAREVSQAKIAGSDEGLIGKTLNTVASLVTIRRTDVKEGPGTDAILARAEAALKESNLAAAISAMKELSGAPADRAAGWVSAAEARLAVDDAIAKLRAAALAAVSEAG